MCPRSELLELMHVSYLLWRMMLVINYVIYTTAHLWFWEDRCFLGDRARLPTYMCLNKIITGTLQSFVSYLKIRNQDSSLNAFQSVLTSAHVCAIRHVWLSRLTVSVYNHISMCLSLSVLHKNTMLPWLHIALVQHLTLVEVNSIFKM